MKEIPRSRIEGLEPRIAPASMLTFNDIDGDRVTVNSSLGTLTPAMLDLSNPGGNSQLYSLLLPASFAGSKISIVATKVGNGDGRVNVGQILAAGIDLRSVSVDGDLGKLVVGDDDPATAAVRTFTAHSIGKFGTTTQNPLVSPELSFFMVGHVGTFKVTTSVYDATITTQDESGTGSSMTSFQVGGIFDGATLTVNGTLRDLKIAGDIIGGNGNRSGAIVTALDLTAAQIGGTILGGEGLESGSILVGKNAGNMLIQGSVVGGTNNYTGFISIGHTSSNGTAKKITVAGDILGGTGQDSGAIQSSGSVQGFFLKGFLQGGKGTHSGAIAMDLFLTEQTGVGFVIKKDIIGGEGESSGVAKFDAQKVVLGGSVLGGTGDYSGAFIGQGSVCTVLGNVVGNSGLNSGMFGGSDEAKYATLRGSVFGGSGEGSGQVGFAGQERLIIEGDVRGGSVTGSSSLQGTGFINVYEAGEIRVLGSIISGTDASEGTLSLSGAILANHVGQIYIGGNLSGNNTEPAEIITLGDFEDHYSVRKLEIRGNVQFANILIGSGFTSFTPDVRMGDVLVRGTWRASNLAVGSDAGPDGRFGTNDDHSGNVGPGSTAILDSIAILGGVTGTLGGRDQYGIVAQQITKAKFGGSIVALNPGPQNDHLNISPTTGDVNLHETLQ